MIYEEEATAREKKISRNLAIGIHVVIVVLFIFGVSWHKRQSEPGAVADLWGTMAPPRQEAPRPEPPLKITPKIEKELPPPPPPKPEVKPQPKPDIALKEKLEKERKLREQQELERKKEDEAKKLKAAELKKKEEEKRKLAEQQELERKKEEEFKRLTAEKELAAKEAAAKAAAAQSRAFNEYITKIQNKVRSNIPEMNLQGSPEVEFEVVILPGGEIMDGGVRLRRSSGVPAYDQAVERAILKSSPLPVPPPTDPLFNEFRRPTLKIRPR